MLRIRTLLPAAAFLVAPAAFAQFAVEPSAIGAPAGFAGSSYGTVLGALGDIDGDGFPDLAIGAPDATNPDDPQTGEGMVFIHRGTESGPNPVPFVALDGDLPFIRFGAVICGVGDVDADGFCDVAIAAPDYGNGQANEGRVTLYRGSAAGLVLTPLWTFESNVAESKGGSLLVPLGDVDGDGHADLGFSDVDIALACAFLGSSSGFPSVPNWIYPVNGQGQGGMCGLGDVSGDGFDDVLVAGFDAVGSNTAKAYLFRGGLSGLENSPAGAFVGATGCSGMRLAPGGDFNADGRPDALIGDLCDRVLRTYRGNGKTLKPSVVVPQPFHSATFPNLLAGGFDADADGFDDAVTGDPGPSRVWLHRGRKAGIDPVAQEVPMPPSSVASTSFASALAFVGDLDLDGAADLLVGDPDADSDAEPSPNGAGKVFVFAGEPQNATLGPTFRAGDRLEMILSPLETANFDAVKGTKLALQFSAPAGSKLEIDLIGPSGEIESSHDLKIGSNAASLTLKTKASGRYGIVFGRKGSDAVALAVDTAETLPKKAKARFETKSLKKGKSLSSFDVLALPGASLAVTFAPSGALSTLSPWLESPGLTVIPTTGYQSGDATALSIVGLPLYAPGRYRLFAEAVATTKTTLEVGITPIQPPPGTATIVIP